VVTDEGGEFLGRLRALARDASGEWSTTSRRSEHTIITAEMLSRELPEAGFEAVELLGGHDRHALGDADESVIVVARRAGG
jgi:hypothetical protein